MFLHCVHSQRPTPSVALLHAAKYGGLSAQDSAAAIRTALGVNEIGGLLWTAALDEARMANAG
ncbi:hypothetical protein [Flexivirga alba]|uniref:Uncharacterized protein n=1 Tax=Flexivirga alba TaxID=702742 RepID=A0ABW2AIG2_9MICO